MNTLKNLLIYFLSITFFIGCKKTDTKTESPNSTSYAEKFFEKSLGINEQTEKLINLLKTENEKSNFLASLPANAGLPVWDKLIKDKSTQKGNKGQRGVIADKNGNFIIPLSNDNFTLSAVLFALYQGDKYNFYCYTNDYAYKVCNDPYYTVEEREKVLALFLYMSNYVFNISEFQNIPKELFLDVRGKEDGPFHKYLFLKPVKEPKNLPETTYVENLKFVEVCFKSWSANTCTCMEPSPETCDWCDICTVTKCFGDWVDDPSSEPGGGSNGDVGIPPLPVTGGNTPSSPPPLPCPGTAWYAKVPLTGSGCTPSTESIVAQQLNQILHPGDSYNFQPINPGDVVNVTTVAEFENYLKDINENTSFSLSFPPYSTQQDEKTERARVNRVLVGGYDFFVKLAKNSQNIWSVSDVTSSEWGMTIGWSWLQQSYTVSSAPGNVITVEVFGYENYNIFVEGIGTVYKALRKYSIKVNAVSGEITSITKLI